MPKIKTHKATARRIGRSGSGLFMRTRQGKSHLRRRKATRIRRKYAETLPLASTDRKRLKRLLPYGR